MYALFICHVRVPHICEDAISIFLSMYSEIDSYIGRTRKMLNNYVLKNYRNIKTRGVCVDEVHTLPCIGTQSTRVHFTDEAGRRRAVGPC